MHLSSGGAAPRHHERLGRAGLALRADDRLALLVLQRAEEEESAALVLVRIASCARRRLGGGAGAQRGRGRGRGRVEGGLGHAREGRHDERRQRRRRERRCECGAVLERGAPDLALLCRLLLLVVRGVGDRLIWSSRRVLVGKAHLVAAEPGERGCV